MGVNDLSDRAALDKCIKDLIASCDEKSRKGFERRLKSLRKTYDEMSAIYQESKDKGAEIPLK